MATRLALLRHGPTAWSRDKRIQGLSDQLLDAEGRAEVSRWRLPPEFVAAVWVTSPLRRCCETALLLAGSHRRREAIAVEPRLIEMDHGQWEGERLADLRARLGADMAAREARGLDYRAPGGESPREVQARLRPWLAEIGAAGGDVLAVTHKGIMRALYAQATGWDMIAKPPVKLRDAALHLFLVAADGSLALERLNLGLLPELWI
ncbi:MAG: histidine phosphatase family protein [Pseudomonadota bacterium]